MMAALMVGVTMGAIALSTESIAQTDTDTSTDLSEIRSQYQRDLDTWMLKAYSGDKDAQFKVGLLFTERRFNTQDYEQAAYWYKQAANQNHALAQFNLGHQYLIGQGVPRNETEAMKWWLKAAQQDHALASFNVGRGYYLGIGFEEDHDLARYWFEQAAQNQEPKSIEILEKLGWAQKGQYKKGPIQPTLASVSPESVNTEKPFATRPTIQSDIIESNNAESNNFTDQDQASVTHPLAIYTTPEKRSVLITIIDNRDGLNVIEESNEWIVLTLDQGLPVWVHENFINATGRTGTITGSNVNARSVPLIASGTVVGQLNKNQVVSIISQQKEWYRVQSPKHFKGWAKTADFITKPIISASNKPLNQGQVASNGAPSATQTTSASTATSSQSGSDPVYSDVNEWLFAQNERSYTMQLASFDDPAKTSQFASLKEFKDNPQLRTLTSERSGTQWTYFLYGVYNDRQAADTAKKDINQKRAWIRTFGRLQENRCLAWKQQIPVPSELNKYCVR